MVIANLDLIPDPNSINMNPQHWFIPDSIPQTDDAIDLTVVFSLRVGPEGGEDGGGAAEDGEERSAG